jgi:dienelactone hydrolase
MKIAVLATVFSLILVLSRASSAAPLLWGDLEPGPHAVGYQSRVEADLSRTAFDRPTAGRAVTIEIWYPTVSAKSDPMRFDRYVLDEAGIGDRSGSAEETKSAIASFTAGLDSRLREKSGVDRLLASSTAAHRNAPYLRGTFPLVLYFHTSASSKSAQCEYLASYGLIVVSTAVAGTFERDLDVGLSGAESQARDLEFAAAWAARSAPIDRAAVGVVGMSFGGISELLFAERHPEVRAIVSLDGGAGSPSGAALVQQSPYFELARLQAPLLHLYQPEGADLAFLETLRYSERTFARFPSLHHGDFSGSGFFPAVASPGFDDSARRPKGEVNRLMCRFLLAHLAGDRASAASLESAAGKPGSTQPAFTITRRPGLPAPPTFEELKAMIRQDGFAAVGRAFERLKDRDRTPFSQDTFRKLGSWLFEQRRNEDARSLFELQLSMYPNSARSHFLLALACERLDDKRGTRDHFARVLELLPNDVDLDPPTRRRLETTSKESLAALELGPPAS